jgi:hypothetical protein
VCSGDLCVTLLAAELLAIGFDATALLGEDDCFCAGTCKAGAVITVAWGGQAAVEVPSNHPPDLNAFTCGASHQAGIAGVSHQAGIALLGDETRRTTTPPGLALAEVAVAIDEQFASVPALVLELSAGAEY